LTDEKLVQAVRNGDSTAFEEIVKRYESLVASTVIGMLGRCPEADDVGQETFIRFYKSIHNFRGESRIGTYLTRIAINLSLNEIKRRQRKNLLFSGVSEDIIDNSNGTAFDDDKEVVRQAIQQLDHQFRSVLVLRLIDGYSTKETAEILHIPVGTVLSRLIRAQQKLKKYLTPILGEHR